MSEAVIEAAGKNIAPDAQFGPGVVIKARELRLGPGCRIGVETEDNFRCAAGVRVECDVLEMAAGTVIDRSVLIRGGILRFGRGCRIGPGATFRVEGELHVGAGGQFGPDCVVEGRRITVGRELWTGPQVRIGGGSALEVQSELEIGHWCHLGMRVFVNTARKVSIGNEVGIGTGSSIFTHGAYQSFWNGYPVSFAPVTIEDNCWIPGAVINPGVTIGRGAVIGVGSVVTKSVPAGSLAAGIPCKVLKESAFPRPLTAEERRELAGSFLAAAAPILADFTGGAAHSETDGFSVADSIVRYEAPARIVVERGRGRTVFDIEQKKIAGRCDRLTERLRDLLRRHGVRFRSEPTGAGYADWSENDK
jgi:acetyltransferase-like isoleucine patch superfamily enzyme